MGSKVKSAVRRFRIDGMRPAYGEQCNVFLKACDLGVQGVFIHESITVKVTMAEDATDPKRQLVAVRIAEAFKSEGWEKVEVVELFA